MFNYFQNGDLSPPPPPPLTEYEREGDKNVSEKNNVFEKLRMPKLVSRMGNEFGKNKAKSKMLDEESEDYVPEFEDDISKKSGKGAL